MSQVDTKHTDGRANHENYRIRKSTLQSFVLIFAYKLILDASYYFVISPVWGYMGFIFDFNFFKLIESFFILFIVFSFMPKNSERLSAVMIWLMILFCYIPMLTLFAMKDEARSFMYPVTFFWVFIFLLVDTPYITIKLLRGSKTIKYFLYFTISVLGLSLLYLSLGFSLQFDLSKVYEVREKFGETRIPLSGYFISWLGYILNPVFFAIFIRRRKLIMAAMIVLFELFLFSSTGNKTLLFALVFVSVLMWTIGRKNPLALIAAGLAGVIGFGIFSYFVFGDLWIASLFTRRAILDQPQQYFFYYDFFSKHEFTFLSQHHIFLYFSDYPYHLEPPNLIGKVYFGSQMNSANTGIIGDAFMNFGFSGLFIWGVILILLFKVIDSLTLQKDKKVAVAAVAMPVITLMNSALLTNLLTHGLLLSLFTLYLLPRLAPLHVKKMP